MVGNPRYAHVDIHETIIFIHIYIHIYMPTHNIYAYTDTSTKTQILL